MALSFWGGIIFVLTELIIYGYKAKFQYFAKLGNIKVKDKGIQLSWNGD